MPTTKKNFAHDFHKKSVEELPYKAETAQNVNLAQSQSWQSLDPTSEANTARTTPVFTNPSLGLQLPENQKDSTKITTQTINTKIDNRKTNTLAVASGLAGAILILFTKYLGATVAVFLILFSLIGGITAISQIKKRKEKGKGWALLGIWAGALIITLSVFVLLILANFHT